MATGYNYRPMDTSKEEIRLLSIRQKPPHEDQLLEFHLEHASLADAQATPEYIAISYVWGDATQRRHIVVDGKQVSVPANAEIALRNLHRAATKRRKGIRPRKYRLWPFALEVRFWIDSVCIEQANLEERGHQVAIMWRVFSSAAMVLIWLGEEDGKTVSAIQEITSLVHECRQETNDFKQLKETTSTKTANGYFIRRYCHADLTKLNWSALEAFYSSSWFTRLWVVQETVLAKQAYCVRGKHIIDWTSIGRAALWLNHKSYFERTNLNRSLRGLQNASLIQEHNEDSLNLENLLTESYEFDASDPRDRVFGFLGLFQASNTGTTILQALMPPDYSASAGHIYAKVTKAMIEPRRRLSILSSVQYARGFGDIDTLDIPTWVPPLHLRPRAASSNYYEASPLFLSGSWPGSCNGLPLHLDVTTDDLRTLKLKGCIVGEVIAGAEQAVRYGPWEERKTLIVQSYELAQTYTRTSEEAFGRTMTVDSGERLDVDMCSLTDWSLFLQWCRGTEKVNDVAVYYDKAMADHSMLRRFFVTHNGFIGMGTRHIEEGNAVCILFGGRVPYTLRPAKDGSDTWTFVGDAYVDGIMDGEYIQRLQNEGRLDVGTRWFSLR